MSCSCFGAMLQKKRDKQPKQDEEGKRFINLLHGKNIMNLHIFLKNFVNHISLLLLSGVPFCGDWFECFTYFSSDVIGAMNILLECCSRILGLHDCF